MSAQKKRGLGRGLGALIPAGPEVERPVDVFFPAGERSTERDLPTQDGSATTPDGVPEDRTASTSVRSTSWDAALSSGRLAIRTGPAGRPSAQPPTGRSTSALSSADAIEVVLGTQGPAQTLDGEPRSARSGDTIIEVDESGGSDPSGIGVITGPLPVIDEDEVGGRVGSVRVPHDALGVRSRQVPTAEETPLDDTSTVSRETAAPVGHEDAGTSRDLLPVPGATFAELPVDAIRANTWQPRAVFDESELEELVDSIREIGVLQPVVVRRDKASEGQYELIMGERRWRATKLAGLETIPAIVRETDDADMLRDALLENLHRAQLNPLEEAAAYRQLLDDFGCTHEELATRIARSRPQISNTLRLLKLPPLVQRRVAAGILSAGHARALLGLSDGAEIERVAQRVVSEGLSVRATEEVVALLTSGSGETKRRAPRPGQRSAAADELAGRLSDRFETRVKIMVGKSKGRLTVEFASVEDLNRILSVMAPEEPGLLK